MKPTSALLALSVVVNLALAGVILLRPAASRSVSSPASGATTVNVAGNSATTKESASFQAALASGDAAALAAAGVPPDVIRALTVGRAFETFQAKMRELRPAPTGNKYWSRPEGYNNTISREVRLGREKAQSDFSEAVRSAYGQDLNEMFDNPDSNQSFLSAEKSERLHRIERDYAELREQIYADQSGIQLPSDREKLKLLDAEKKRDIAAVFTPEEREQYELRVSQTATNVRVRYGDALQSEDDYKKIFVLQKTFDDRWAEAFASGPPSPELQQARRDEEQKLLSNIRDLIGPEQWAAVQRTNDGDVRTLASLTKRLNLPTAATDAALAAREGYAAQSLQINANATLSAAERKTQLQALATKAQADLQSALGTEGGTAFAQRAQWVSWLKNGQAYSTNPKDSPNASMNIGTSVYQVPAPGAGPTPPRG